MDSPSIHYCTAPWAGLSRPLETRIFSSKNVDWAESFAPNGTMLGVGDNLKMGRYADLLESVATNGADALYTGTTANKIVRGVQQNGGIITLEDLESYRVKISAPLQIE
jgi:gamma-glutamyltranspeptidase